jgi:hypothetical protein
MSIEQMKVSSKMESDGVVIPSIKRGVDGPSQLHSITNPASRVRKDMNQATIVNAILKHCKASKEQNAALA